MFHIEEDEVRLNDGNWFVCKKEDIPRAMTELEFLYKGNSTITNTLVTYTNDGIDRYFVAEPNFVTSKEQWDIDAETDWANVADHELFNRYQSHAESYCWGCREQEIEPTYNGFRRWLMQLRDME